MLFFAVFCCTSSFVTPRFPWDYAAIVRPTSWISRCHWPCAASFGELQDDDWWCFTWAWWILEADGEADGDTDDMLYLIMMYHDHLGIVISAVSRGCLASVRVELVTSKFQCWHCWMPWWLHGLLPSFLQHGYRKLKNMWYYVLFQHDVGMDYVYKYYVFLQHWPEHPFHSIPTSCRCFQHFPTWYPQSPS